MCAGGERFSRGNPAARVGRGGARQVAGAAPARAVDSASLPRTGRVVQR